MNRLATCLLLFLTGLPGLAAGQTVRVSAGEHADFTRLVLRLPVGTSWSVTEADNGPAFETIPAGDYDLSRLFDRIPRRRLASVRVESGRLILDLACACPIRAWQERTGIVVIDIQDEPTTTIADERFEGEVATQQPSAAPSRDSLARQVGEALARSWRENASAAASEEAPDVDEALGRLPEELVQRFAQAFSQGVLQARTDTASDSVTLQASDIPQDFPQNLRIVDVASRRRSEPELTSLPDPACQDSGALDFLLDRPDIDFLRGVSTLGHDLFGEFDQPSDQAFLGLVHHYLAAGFGAEARTLINNFRDPLPGRDLLVGLSDLFEGRMSNSRLRLAQARGCGGVAEMAAVLAQPENMVTPDTAAAIALTFVQLPPPLRAIFAPELVTELLEAGAADTARVVVDSLRSSGWATGEEIALVEAMLEIRRGEAGRAVDRLDPVVLRHVVGTQNWLDIALRQQAPVADDTLDDAEALAAQHRGTDDAIRMMSSVIRLRVLSNLPERALITLDRLESWRLDNSPAAAVIATLRDETWNALARLADDRSLVALSLARTDWLTPNLTLATRQALAGRFLDLGFANAADRLVQAEQDEPSLRLRARAAMLRGEPDIVSGLLEGDLSPDANLLRADAASRLGAHDQATEFLDNAGNLDAAARSAVMQGDWRRLEDLREQGASLPTLDGAASRFLALAPGVATVLQDQTARAPLSRPQTLPVGEPTSVAQEEGVAAARPDDSPATAVSPLAGAAEAFDSLGMVSRAGVLLAESERLRGVIGQTLQLDRLR